MTGRLARSFACLAAAAACLACGAAQDQGSAPDPKELLGRGDYAAARLAAEAKGGTDPSDRAVIALSHIAERPDRAAAAEAVKALSRGAARPLAAEAAAEMLALYPTAPDCADGKRALLAAEIALGALGMGPVAAQPPPEGSKGASEAALAVAIVERLRLGLAGAEAFDGSRVLAVWNGCITLLGRSMRAPTDPDAWLLFVNLSGLAVLVTAAAPTSDLSRALLESSVTAVEANPGISVAVRCDLGSPFDELRAALTRARDLGGRLERAVAASLGCTRGQYAPRRKE
ncbi:MAG: hypothetical protein M0R80_20570 [Proteobacteria bacterium]|jgi:hypothetical protein|nr:hypothetical protein [Pseudomonadota bacterium]